MISGIEKALAKRIWFVPAFSIWGTSNDGELDFVTVEEADSTQTVLFGHIGIGESLQAVAFDGLTDHRGNKLPATIESARVIPRSRTASSVFVVGEESGSGFNIARDAEASGPIVADLLIIELGN